MRRPSTGTPFHRHNPIESCARAAEYATTQARGTKRPINVPVERICSSRTALRKKTSARSDPAESKEHGDGGVEHILGSTNSIDRGEQGCSRGWPRPSDHPGVFWSQAAVPVP